MLLLGFLLAAAGFSSLALTMHRHQPLLKTAPSLQRRLGLRFIGACLLMASLKVCIHSSGWGIGLVEWTGLLTAAATCTVLGLTYWPSTGRAGSTQVLHQRKKN
jgi:hypothetical protein